jgi:hypothetical protein
VLAIAAALDCAPVHLLAPIKEEELVEVTPGLPPATAAAVREWIRGERGPLRFSLGVVEPNLDDLAAFMSQQPASYIERAGAAVGLTEDEIEDTKFALQNAAERNQENLPWPEGRPAMSEREAQLVRARGKKIAEIQAMDQQLAQLRKEEGDG